MKKPDIQIYGTIGPACKDEETLYAMIREGMSGLRLNLSHTSLSESQNMLAAYRQACNRAEVSTNLLIDMQGPEMRLGILKEPMLIKEHEKIVLGGQVPIEEAIIHAIRQGDEILLDDGKILLKAQERIKEGWLCEVIRPGMISSRKSLKIAGRETDLPAITRADRENLQAAGQYGVKAVMQPFVRNGNDIKELRSVLHEYGEDGIQIFAKIENQNGIDYLDEIIEEADMIVIARGDLGNDMPLWHLPAVQKDIEEKCLRKNKLFMVVTQMLASMINSPVPTRAEVNDIFYAVIDGASAIMATNETAVGKYPAEVIRYMKKTADDALEWLSMHESNSESTIRHDTSSYK